MATKWQPLLRGQSDPSVFRNACGGLDKLDPRAGPDQRNIDRLQERARLNGRSLKQEVKALLEGAAGTLTMREAPRVSEQWRRRLRRAIVLRQRAIDSARIEIHDERETSTSMT